MLDKESLPVQRYSPAANFDQYRINCIVVRKVAEMSQSRSNRNTSSWKCHLPEAINFKFTTQQKSVEVGVIALVVVIFVIISDYFRVCLMPPLRQWIGDREAKFAVAVQHKVSNVYE